MSPAVFPEGVQMMPIQKASKNAAVLLGLVAILVVLLVVITRWGVRTNASPASTASNGIMFCVVEHVYPLPGVVTARPVVRIAINEDGLVLQTMPPQSPNSTMCKKVSSETLETTRRALHDLASASPRPLTVPDGSFVRILLTKGNESSEVWVDESLISQADLATRKWWAELRRLMDEVLASSTPAGDDECDLAQKQLTAYLVSIGEWRDE